MLWENWTLAFATLVNDAVRQAAPGLSDSATAMLLTVHHWQPVTLSEAAGILAISQPTATRIADGLQKAGFLKRGSKTGRAVPLTLTRAGEQTAIAVAEERADAAHRLLSVLGLPEQANFAACVRRMLEAATTSRRFARTTCRFCDHGLCRGEDCPVGARAMALEGPKRGKQRRDGT
jgi:DNA-binding MarR family transcriptional regulator